VENGKIHVARLQNQLNILSELKKKIKITEMNGYNMFDTLNDEVSTILQTKPRMTSEKTS
jgi:hypothetical protein